MRYHHHRSHRRSRLGLVFVAMTAQVVRDSESRSDVIVIGVAALPRPATDRANTLRLSGAMGEILSAGKRVRSMRTVRNCIGAAVVILSSTVLSGMCRAQDATPNPYPRGFVIAESRFGNGTVRGDVRATAVGWEVQLPGGRWVYCRRSCSETLRVETVDFFQSNMAGAGQLTNECGIFGCLDLKYPH
jgi:hypothetical protein